MRREEDFSRDLYSGQLKRLKFATDVRRFDGVDFSASDSNEITPKKPATTSNVIDFSDPFSVRKGLDSGKFGSVTKEIEALFAQKMQILGLYSENFPRVRTGFLDEGKSQVKQSSKKVHDIVVIDLEDESVASETPTSALNIITIDSDKEGERDQCDMRPSSLFENAVLDQQCGETFVQVEEVIEHVESKTWVEDANFSGEIHSEVKKNEDVNVVEEHVGSTPIEDASVRGEAESRIMKDKDVTVVNEHVGSTASIEDTSLSGKTGNETKKDNGVYVGLEDEENHETSSEDDGLEDVWNEMSMGLELSKDFAVDHSRNEQVREDKENCEHSFILKDDLGYVCRICGIITKGIETIIEFQYNKVRRSSRTYMPESWSSTDKDSNGTLGLNLCGENMMPNEVYAHPRHSKRMKPHQKEGFDFLVSNLVGDNPGGCILAHAPGSGKTFMIISFVQSFLAKYPHARPLVVLPKGIVSTWKKEFQMWQIEDFPLYDTAKADNRIQQLEVLKQWVGKKSILFLSYQQFSSIVCDLDSNVATTSCREILLKVPTILVLDEGHTPRNDSTDIFQALVKVQTPRKVVLSGTLYQNHVKEVFNILNLVRTNFLKTETSRTIVNRIKSRVDMSLSGARKHFKASSDAAFFEMVEDTLQNDKDLRRKASVIHDLREMTHKVLHYYKGDFLDELPGLVDFTVVLNLSSKQKRQVEMVKKLPANFKANSVGSAVYLHPMLQSCSDNGTTTDDKMDELLENLDVADGVKAKFFLNMLSLCEAKKEKLLVFSQYLVPLKFLERLAVKEKGWCLGREIFVISGKSSNDDREWSTERFNNSPAAKVFFGSIKACGEGISLVGASRIIIMDIHLNPSITRQAIGRAFRPGQMKKVFAYRLVAADSPEVEDYGTCSKKELISKMWFESKETSVYRDFEVETVDINECGDEFLAGNPVLEKDIKVLYRR